MKMVLLAGLAKVKDFVVWSWTYLWAFWFLLVSRFPLTVFITSSGLREAPMLSRTIKAFC